MFIDTIAELCFEYFSVQSVQIMPQGSAVNVHSGDEG